MISLSTDGLESIYDSDTLPQNQESQDGIYVSKTEELNEIPLLLMDTDVESEATQNLLLVVTNECEPLPPTTSAETVPGETSEILNNVNDKDLLDTPNMKYVKTPSTSVNKKWDVTSRRNLKSRKHPALIANVPKKTLFDELTQAKLELVQFQKELWKQKSQKKGRCGSLKKVYARRRQSLKKRSANGWKKNIN